MGIFNFILKTIGYNKKGNRIQNEISQDLRTAEYLIFDTETNDRTSDRVALQIAWLLADKDGHTLCSKSYIIRQNVKINPKALEVHGITQSIIQSKGVEKSIVYKEFITDMAKCGSIVGHNLSFDIQAVENDLRTLGIGSPFPSKKKICTMSSSRDYVQAKTKWGKTKNPKLSELAGFLFYNDITRTFDGCHNALFDVELTAKCFFELKKLEAEGKIRLRQIVEKEKISIPETPPVERMKPNFDAKDYEYPCIGSNYFFPSSAGGAYKSDSEQIKIHAALRKNCPALEERFKLVLNRLESLSTADFMNCVTSLSYPSVEDICACEKCRWNIKNFKLEMLTTNLYRVNFLMVDAKEYTMKYQDLLRIDNDVNLFYEDGYKFEREGSIEDAIRQYSKMLKYPCELSDIMDCVERMSIMLSKVKRFDEVFRFIDKAIDKVNNDYKGVLNSPSVLSTLDSLHEEKEKRIRMSKRVKSVDPNNLSSIPAGYKLKMSDFDDFVESSRPTIFKGKKVLITGRLDAIGILSREEGNDIISSMGGLPQKSLVKSIDFVVIGIDAGPRKIEDLKIMQHNGHKVVCVNPEVFKLLYDCCQKEIITTENNEPKDKIDELEVRLSAIKKLTKLASRAMKTDYAEGSFTPEEFEYLKKEGFVSDSNIKR